MASPQKENGFTPIANELLEAITKANISGGEYKIFHIVLRLTYGWKKKSDQISLKTFSEKSGMHRTSVCRAINALVSKNILGSLQNATTPGKKSMEATTYWIEKDYEKWKSLPSRTNATTPPSLQNATRGSLQNAQKVVSKTLPSKEIKLKKVVKERQPPKKTFGDGKHVKLTEEEHQNLIADLGQKTTDLYISELDDYIGSKGDKYKSHWHTIRSWYRRKNPGDKTVSASYKRLEELLNAEKLAREYPGYTGSQKGG